MRKVFSIDCNGYFGKKLFAFFAESDIFKFLNERYHKMTAILKIFLADHVRYIERYICAKFHFNSTSLPGFIEGGTMSPQF